MDRGQFQVNLDHRNMDTAVNRLVLGMLAAALVFLVMLVVLNRRMAQIERAGIQVSSLQRGS